ncbi:unnamed protein product, partial [Polarella glacialis]
AELMPSVLQRPVASDGLVGNSMANSRPSVTFSEPVLAGAASVHQNFIGCAAPPLSFTAVANGAASGQGSRSHRIGSSCDLHCPICEEVMYRPVRTPCGHCFCLACLSLWLDECLRRSCPLCRAVLGEGDALPDADLECRALDLIGSDYYERELDNLSPDVVRKLRSHNRRLERLADSKSVAFAGSELGALTGAATVWGASATAYLGTFAFAQAGIATSGSRMLLGAHSVASIAFWSTAFSTEFASDALLAGTLAGAGTSTFLAGIKLAAWLDGQCRYCLLRAGFTHPGGEENAAEQAVCVLNLLQGEAIVRIFKGVKRRRCGRPSSSLADSMTEYVAAHSGPAEGRRRRPRRGHDLEAAGEALAEFRVAGRSEMRIELPDRAPRCLLLSVALPGLLSDREVGFGRVRRGHRFILGELEGASGSSFRRCGGEASVAGSSCSEMEDAAEALDEVGEGGIHGGSGAEDSEVGLAHMLARLFGFQDDEQPDAASAETDSAAAVEVQVGERPAGNDVLGVEARQSQAAEDAATGDFAAAIASLLGAGVLSEGQSGTDEEQEDDEEAEVTSASSVGPVTVTPSASTWQRTRWEDARPLRRCSQATSSRSSCQPARGSTNQLARGSTTNSDNINKTSSSSSQPARITSSSQPTSNSSSSQQTSNSSSSQPPINSRGSSSSSVPETGLRGSSLLS